VTELRILAYRFNLPQNAAQLEEPILGTFIRLQPLQQNLAVVQRPKRKRLQYINVAKTCEEKSRMLCWYSQSLVSRKFQDFA
jgi:hypothetical protein